MRPQARPETRLVRFDACPDDPFRPAATPIYQTATFEQDSPLEFGRYDYSASGNPTRTVLETLLADLEHADRAFAFASGLAAITAVTRLLEAGEEIVAGDDLYGGAFRLFSRIIPKRGVPVRYADASDPAAIAAEVGPQTRLVYVETPTNPLLRVCDLRDLSRRVQRASPRPLLVVDNTLLSPYLQNPLDLGADLVVHSCTKSLCGHADVTAGAVCLREPDPTSRALADELYLIQNGEGAALAPFDSFLLLRGLKTLAVRLDRQQDSARRVAAFLADHPAVRRVHFVGLADHPGAAFHAAQSRGPGCVLAFETGSVEASVAVAKALRLFSISVSFGSVASSVSMPATMSHASIPAELRSRHAPPQDLVRLSIGLEAPEDLIADLDAALTLASSQLAAEPPAIAAGT